MREVTSSIRWRVAVPATLAVLVVLVVASLGILIGQRQRLISELDEGTPAQQADAHEDVDEATSALAWTLVVAVPVVAVALGGLVWWLVGRTLRPVEGIRSEVARIGGRELHRRVPEPSTDDEVGRLARTMNEMLTRVEDATGRQQRFVADASHELRSPLTRMRATLEVDLAHPDRADATATHRSVLEETVGLQHLVDDLLRLARIDAARPDEPTARELVDLDDVVLRLARRLRADDRVAVDTQGVGAAQVVGDRAQLARAVGNVVDNAQRYAAGTVTFSLAEQNGHAVLMVADDGPGIPPSERERVFERFTRLDAARGHSTGGTGLGLAIAREIVQRHHGTLAVDPTHHGGTCLVLTLPTTTP
jgi:signal transduction histidine kinase